MNENKPRAVEQFVLKEKFVNTVEQMKANSDVNESVILETESLFLMTSPCSVRDKNIYRITKVTHQRLIKGSLCGP